MTTEVRKERLADLRSAYVHLGKRLREAGAPSDAFSSAECLYRAAVTADGLSDFSAFVAGVLRSIGDDVEWDHGNGTRRGMITGFYVDKVEVRLPSGARCDVEFRRVRTPRDG